MKPLTTHNPVLDRYIASQSWQETSFAHLEDGVMNVKSPVFSHWTHQTEQTSQKFTDILQVSFNECLHWANLAQTDPSVHHIHEFRRAIRKLKTFVWLLPLPKNHPPLRPLNACLRRTHRILGVHRTLQVALRDAKKFGIDPSFLRAKLSAHTKKIKKKLPLLIRQEWTEDLGVSLQHIGPFTLHDSVEQIEKATERLILQAERPPRKDPARHKLRLRVKKISIFLSTIKTPKEQLATIIKLQKALGRWHDLLSLENLLSDTKSIRKSEFKKGREKLRKARKAAWLEAKHLLSSLRSELTATQPS